MLPRLARIGSRLTTWTIRWVPDAWVIALGLTGVVWLLAVFGADAPPFIGDTPLGVCEKTRSCGAFDAWSGGLWRLLTLTSQFALALVAAHACASSRMLYRLMDRLARLPDSDRPRQAIVLMGLFSVGTAWLNWAVNIVICATFVPIIARRNPKVDFRLLVATAYVGLGAVWHGGLSGSAPLIAATPDNFLIKQQILSEPLPISATLFHPFNLIYIAIVAAVAVALAVALHPAAEDAQPLSVERAEALLRAPAAAPDPAGLRPAERIDRLRLLSLTAGCMLIAWLVVRFMRQGVSAWDINGYNAAFLGLALVLHDSPRTFLDACADGARNAWGVIVQFPLYAGIFGLMTMTPLAERMTDWVSSVGSRGSYPLVVYGLSAVINYLVPSGGSQWVIEAPYILAAGAHHGLPHAATTLAFAYGDMSTNLIQPFWAIPLMSVTGVSFGQIMGYCLLIFLACTAVSSVAMVLMPLFF